MSVSRLYRLQARAEAADQLELALQELAAKIRPLDGCAGVDIYRDNADPSAFLFVEHWASVVHHERSGRALGKTAFAAIGACLDAPPVVQMLTRCA